MSVEYPIFAFEKDDHSMRLIENEGRILHRLEAIDIDNNEYVFWDSTGVGVCIAVFVGAFKSKLKSVASCPAPFPIHDAFKMFSESLGRRATVVDGPPVEVWRHLQEQIGDSLERTRDHGAD